jgi:hypothetical protein
MVERMFSPGAPSIAFVIEYVNTGLSPFGWVLRLDILPAVTVRRPALFKTVDGLAAISMDDFPMPRLRVPHPLCQALPGSERLEHPDNFRVVE